LTYINWHKNTEKEKSCSSLFGGENDHYYCHAANDLLSELSVSTLLPRHFFQPYLTMYASEQILFKNYRIIAIPYLHTGKDRP
jgi:hypothetical protein